MSSAALLQMIGRLVSDDLEGCERERWRPNLFTIGSDGLRKLTKSPLSKT